MTETTQGFIARHGLWSADQKEAAEKIVEQVRAKGIRNVRVGWGDQHGIVRGKTVSAEHFVKCLTDGKDFQLVTAIFDTTNHPIVPPFGAENDLGVPEMIGLPDGVLVPDPLTFRILPWVDDTAWCLSDAYFSNGAPCPLSTRQVLREQVAKLEADGLGMKVGLEFEFYVFRMIDPKLAPADSGYPPAPPEVEMISHGYQYLTENRGDEIENLLSYLQSNIDALGLPVETMEDEWGPGQIEVTFDPLPPMEAADMALLFRSAIKQLCHRKGYHATFMAKPKIPNVFPSGWHMHQSLTDLSSGANVFAADDGKGPLSAIGMHYLAGLLAHSGGTALMSTPTVNGYKRRAPNSFAPLKAAWAKENRGAMLRVIGQPGDPASRIENRVGEPTANPYLYIASQIISGRHGIKGELDPGAPVTAAYAEDRPDLPESLMAAVDAFAADEVLRAELGKTFHNYLVKLKKFEIARFLSEVTDWEHTEYFEMY